MTRRVGIDLGTTYSAVAYINNLGKPEIIKNREGQNTTPSVVLFQGDEPLVGEMAKRAAATAPYDVAQFVKREMGQPQWRFIDSNRNSFKAEEVQALILKRLKEDAELALGEAVTEAVITVPAYFDDARRRATKDAGRIAGLHVSRIINEPTAAALAYGLDGGGDGTLLVFDLGGGTFDVTVMRVAGAEFDVLSTDGDRNLGGFDWDRRLAEWVNEKVIQQGGTDVFEDDFAAADLRDKVEVAKRSLTSVEKANIVLMQGGKPFTISVTRADFEQVTSTLLSRTRRIAESAVEDAGLSWEKIDKVLLIGGSTRMPMVTRMMQEVSGRQPERGINPDEAVALGAAIQGIVTVEAEVVGGSSSQTLDVLPVRIEGQPIVVRDVTSQGLGVLAHRDGDLTIMYNNIIIPRNTQIPAQKSDEFQTVQDNQRSVVFEVTQGDDDDRDYVTIIGAQELSIDPYPAGAPMRVTYSYDVDQIVHIEVFDVTGNKSMGSFEVDNSSTMTSNEVALASQRISGIEVL